MDTVVILYLTFFVVIIVLYTIICCTKYRRDIFSSWFTPEAPLRTCPYYYTVENGVRHYPLHKCDNYPNREPVDLERGDNISRDTVDFPNIDNTKNSAIRSVPIGTAIINK